MSTWASTAFPTPTYHSSVAATVNERFGWFAALVAEPSQRGGLGVFAAETLAAGQVIERCPLLPLTGLAQRALADYCVRLPPGLAQTAALPLGFGALYNHSATPNAVWTVGSDTMTVTAATGIEVGDEILISYGAGWFSSRGKAELA